MGDLIEKARQGRIAAVASMSENSWGTTEIGPQGLRIRSTSRHQNVLFFSARMRHGAGMAVG
ncbi:MAG: hypothetical protein WCC57_17090 [Paracoccaceae bacterium]